MVTLDRADIVDALGELLDVLVAERATAHIRIVGGAALAIDFGRDGTTADIDALYGSANAVDEAARAIARRRGWPDTWLNDKVKMFATHFDQEDDWSTFAVRYDQSPLYGRTCCPLFRARDTPQRLLVSTISPVRLTNDRRCERGPSA